MRVIKDNSKTIEKEVTCKMCGSLIGYIPRDVYNSTTTDIDGHREKYCYIICPVCNKELEVI